MAYNVDASCSMGPYWWEQTKNARHLPGVFCTGGGEGGIATLSRHQLAWLTPS